MKRPAASGSAALLVLVAALSLVAVLAWVPTALGVWHDDGVYLLLGRSLAQGEGLRYLGVSGAPPAPKFPPLYPALLAGIWTAFPDFPENSPFFQMANLALMVGAAALFYLYVRRALELPIPVAFSATGLAWLSPGLWAVTVIPLSEPLFLVSLVLCVWAATKLERSQGTGLRELGLFLVAFALVFHTRTVGAAAALGAVAALFWAGRLRQGVVTGAAAGLLALPWVLWSTRAGEAVPGPLRGTLGGYGGWFFEAVIRDPLQYGFELLERLGLLGWQVVHFLVPGGPEWLRWSLMLLVLPLGLLGLVHVGSRSRSTVWVVLAYLGVLWIWPHNESRFLVPLLPWLILAVVAGGRALADSPHGGAHVRFRRVAPAALGLWAVLFSGLAGWAVVRGRHGQPYQVRTRALEQAAEAVLRLTPSDAVVGAPELWAALHLYTGRTVAPSAAFTSRTSGSPTWGTPLEQYRLWRQTGIDHLLAEHGGGVHGEALDRLDQACPGGAVAVLKVMRGQALVRLDWDEACRRRLGLEN